jgi:hypothetical protein
MLATMSSSGEPKRLDVEDQDDFGFFVGDPRTSFQGYALRKAILHCPADQVVHLLQRFLVGNIEIDLIEIERHLYPPRYPDIWGRPGAAAIVDNEERPRA